MSLPDNPNTLRETYYSVMAGQNDASILPDIETAPSTENRYLDYIARNGGGGGDVTKAYVDEQDAKKTDKVTSAISGNFAGLDENGNLTDSGKKAADFATPTDLAAKQDKITQSATLTLTVNGWDSTLKTQTVTFAHDTLKRNVIDITVSELEDWADCGVVATGETASGISFKCEEIPESALTFTVCSMSVASN